MSQTCSECGQVITKAETLGEVLAALKKAKTPMQWASLEGQDAVDVPNLGKVQVVEVSDNYHDDPGYDTNYIHMVWCVNGTKFYKIEGEKSSYDGTVWNGFVQPVSKQKKEIWVYN